MVNVVNDPRWQMARLMRQQTQQGSPGGGLAALPTAPSTGAVQLGRAASNLSITNPTLRQQIDAIAKGQPAKQEGGFWGSVLGNPVTKTALKGLEAFAVPGRAVVSSARELVDAVDGNSETKASFGDFAKQVKDSQFGFGKAFKIDTGHIWLDRAIGFVGDVALDPLTYMTFGASTGVNAAAKSAGYAGRVKFAERVLANTGDKVLASAVAREGRGALSKVANGAEVLERVGANKFGVYMFGKRIFKESGGLRIPLSGTVGEIGERTLAKVRLAITETRLGKYMQRVSMPKDFLDLRLKLARNQLTPDDAADAIKLFDIVPKQRAARATAQQAFEQELMAILRSEEADLPAYRNTIYKFLENPALLETATDAERRAHDVWRAYLDGKWDDISARWLDADEAAEIGKAKNYVPRVASDDARRWLNSSSENAQLVREIYMEDPFASPNAFTPRALRPGKKWFKQILKEEDMNIESLNRIARESGEIDFDFFDTDIADIMRKYVSDTAEEVGIIERNKALRDTGFFQRIEEQRVRQLEVDEDSILRARSELDEQMNVLSDAEQGFRKAITDLVDGVRAQSDRVNNGLATAERLSEDMSKYLYDMLDDVARRMEAIEIAKNRLASLWGPSRDIPMYSLTDDFPVTLRPVLAEYDQMVADLQDMSVILQDLQEQALREGYSAIDAEDALRQIEDAAAEAQRKMADSMESIQSTMTISNELERVWDSLVDGKNPRVDSVATKLVDELRNILGVKGSSDAKKQAAAVRKGVGSRGRLKDFLRGKLPADATPEEIAAKEFFDKLFDDVNESGVAGIPRSAVSDMTEPEFLNIVLNTGSKDVNLSDIRAAALYAIGRDIKLYGATNIGELPEFSRAMYNQLVNSLKEADIDEAARIASAKASRTAKDAQDALYARMGLEYDDAIIMRGTIEEYDSVIELVDDFVVKFDNEEWRNIAFDENIAAAFNAGVDAFDDMFRHTPWVYEYLEEGKTLGEVFDDISAKSARMKDVFDNSSVEVSTPSTQNLLQGKEVGGQVSKTRKQIVAEYENEMREILKTKVEEARVFKYKRWQYNKAKKASTVRADLAENLVRYQAVSDAVQKFQAIAGVMGAHGLIPSEDMWRGILRTVSHQYGSQFKNKLRRLHAAEDVFNELFSSWQKSLHEMKRLPVDEQIGAGLLFKQQLELAFAGEGGEVLRELFDSQMVNLVDIADMRIDVSNLEAAVRNARSAGDKSGEAAAKARLQKYFDDYVIPWAKQKDPTIRANKGPARNMLVAAYKGDTATSNRVSKAASRAARGPLSRDAAEWEIYRWFNSMLKTVDPQTGNVISPGFIQQEVSDAVKHTIFFNRMSDGYLNVDEFFRTLDGQTNTPSSYAVQLLEWARQIEGPSVIATRQDDIGQQLVEQLGPTAAGAYKKSGKVLAAAEQEAANLADAATRAREVADAFSNPNLTDEQLKALGFTKQMAQSRLAVLKHRELMASVEYANALKDQDIVNFLDMVAGVDFSAFDQGFVVGSNRVPKTTATSIMNTPESVAKRVAEFEGQLAQIDADEATSLKALMAPFVVERNGRIQFKSPEYEKAYRMREQAWNRTRKPEFEYKRNTVRAKIEEAKASLELPNVGATADVEYEIVPVFATMPDGSKIVFTKAEWDSLYRPALKGLEVAELNRQRTALVKRIGELRGSIKRITESPGGTWSPGKKAAIRKIENEILNIQTYIKQLDYDLLVSFKDNRNAALEKVRILIQGRKGDGSDAIKLSDWENIAEQAEATTKTIYKKSPGFEADVQAKSEFNQTGNVEELSQAIGVSSDLTYRSSQTIRQVDPNALKRDPVTGEFPMVERTIRVDSQVNNTLALHFNAAKQSNPDLIRMPGEWFAPATGADARRATLMEAWQQNKSSAVLAEADELAKDAAMAVYNDKEKVARNLQRAAEKAATVAGRTRTVVDDVQSTFRRAVEEMRNSELQAARAAGAEFDTPTPFWATNSEVNYTINGKTYTVPSVQDMLADPMKYVRQSKKRGDIFFDMRKPGNVALWNDASVEARASMSLFGLQSAVMQDTANILRADVVNPSFARVNETYKIMEQWSADIKTLSDNIKTVREALNAERAAASADVVAAQRAATEAKLDVFELAAEIRTTLDNFAPGTDLTEDGLARVETLASVLRKRSILLEEMVSNLPKKADTAAMNSAKKSSTVAKWIQVHMDIINANRELLRKIAMGEMVDGPERVVWNSMLEASVAETRFAMAQQGVNIAKSNLDNATAGVYVDKVLKPATEAFNKAVEDTLKAQGRKVAEDFNMPSFSVSKELNDIMANTNRITDAATVRELSRFLGQYTGFFKAYATLSPGFHVRNSISNTFQLFAAGADVKNMSKALKMWRSLGEHFKNGGTVESWLLTVPEEDRVLAKIAADVTLGLGGGKTDDAFAEFVDLRKNVLTDNAATRTSRKFGQKIEGSARFILAYDSAVKGGDFTESFNRTRRFLVDYNDPTILDDTVRNVIPFWTWISRNLPVQIVTQWTNPKPYVIYQRFANNFSVQDDEQLPPYMRDMNPIKVGKSTYLTPELPFMSTERFIEDTKNPRKMLSMINPGIRVPMELAGGRQFFTGQEFNDENNAAKYAATNLLPMLGQLERITKTGEKSDNLGFARYLGVPIRGVTDAQRNNELMRRMYEIQKLGEQ